MSEPVKRMEALIGSLPERDIPLGHKFLSVRNFESLKELVDSAIYKVKKSLKTDNPKEEYLKVNLEDLSRLKSEVDLYLVMLEPNEEIYDDFGECEIEEEFY